MKSRGKQEAALKDDIVFSLMALILPSDDCNKFMPCPLCPITINFGILYAVLPNSTPTHYTNNINIKNQNKNKNNSSTLPITHVKQIFRKQTQETK